MEVFLLQSSKRWLHKIRYFSDKMSGQRALLNDIVGFKKEFPKRHPIQHLDFYYNNRGTFKIGLYKEYKTENLIDLTAQNTDCKFLEND